MNGDTTPTRVQAVHTHDALVSGARVGLDLTGEGPRSAIGEGAGPRFASSSFSGPRAIRSLSVSPLVAAGFDPRRDRDCSDLVLPWK